MHLSWIFHFFYLDNSQLKSCRICKFRCQNCFHILNFFETNFVHEIFIFQFYSWQNFIHEIHVKKYNLQNAFNSTLFVLKIYHVCTWLFYVKTKLCFFCILYDFHDQTTCFSSHTFSAIFYTVWSSATIFHFNTTNFVPKIFSEKVHFNFGVNFTNTY